MGSEINETLELVPWIWRHYVGLTNWYLGEPEPNQTWIRLCPLPFPLGLVVWGRDEGMNSWIRLVFDVRIRDSVHYRVQFEP